MSENREKFLKRNNLTPEELKKLQQRKNAAARIANMNTDAYRYAMGAKGIQPEELVNNETGDKER